MGNQAYLKKESFKKEGWMFGLTSPPRLRSCLGGSGGKPKVIYRKVGEDQLTRIGKQKRKTIYALPIK